MPPPRDQLPISWTKALEAIRTAGLESDRAALSALRVRARVMNRIRSGPAPERFLPVWFQSAAATTAAVAVMALGVWFLYKGSQPKGTETATLGHAVPVDSSGKGGLADPSTNERSVTMARDESATVVKHDDSRRVARPRARSGVAEVGMVRIEKAGEGTRIEWDGSEKETYLVHRCFVLPGLEACDAVEEVRGSSWTDQSLAPPSAVAFYRVTRRSNLAG